jgi:hypothetical protein
MKFESTPEQQETRRKLTAYAEKHEDGAELTWLRIEHDAKVVMDAKGRSMFTRCLTSLRGRGGYESIRGEGVRLSSPDTALAICNNEGRRVGRTIKNWTRTVDATRERHFDEMTRDDQQQLLARVATAGALRSLAAGCPVAKTLPSPPPRRRD